MTETDTTAKAQAASRPWTKLVVLGLFVGAAGAAYYFFGDALTLESLAEKEAAVRDYQKDSALVVYGAAFLIYVAVTGLSIPGAAPLTLVFGWFFGFWRSLVLVSFASTTGATIAFLLSRYLLRDSIQNRFGERLAAFNRALDREGAFYLFTLRLIPAVPFFVINVVMGLTRIRALTFWWVSQVGMLAGTAVFVYAGSSVPDSATLAEQGVGGILTTNVILAFVVLGLFPLVVKKVFERFRPAPNDDASSPIPPSRPNPDAASVDP